MFFLDFYWNCIWKVSSKIRSEEYDLLTDPVPWDIVEVRIYWDDLSTCRLEVLDLSRWECEPTIFVLGLAIYENYITICELLQEILAVEPYSLSVGSISIDEDGLDKEFFVPGILGCDEFNFTFHHLFVDDIERRELLTDITLVLDISWEIREEIHHGLDLRFAETLDIRISSMEERFGQLHTPEYIDVCKK